MTINSRRKTIMPEWMLEWNTLFLIIMVVVILYMGKGGGGS